MERKTITLRAPITLGVVLIVLVVILGAVWVSGNVIGMMRGQSATPLYLAMLASGSVLLVAVLAGVIAYLTLSVKAFNLNRRQSNFIDSVTHELKSPIASLKLYLQTMSRHDVKPEQQRQFHTMMMEDVERLDSLINHLLDAAWIEHRRQDKTVTQVSLNELLTKCANDTCLRYKLPMETVHIEGEDISIIAAAVEVDMLFRNLIDNAVKYGGSPPRVDVRMVPEDDETVCVSVCDNGSGIPVNLRRKVFGRFVRLGNELERSRPGTGLGLYLVRNVTHALGGRINIRDRTRDAGEEEDPNQPFAGTQIDVTLPIGELPAESADTS